jgi:regulator of replication initiation timing
MTDNFLQRFEEKVMNLLTELETLRKEASHLRQENAQLKADKSNYIKKLQALVSLFDSLNAPTEVNNVSELQIMQSQEEYATA